MELLLVDILGLRGHLGSSQKENESGGKEDDDAGKKELGFQDFQMEEDGKWKVYGMKAFVEV